MGSPDKAPLPSTNVMLHGTVFSDVCNCASFKNLKAAKVSEKAVMSVFKGSCAVYILMLTVMENLTEMG